MSSAHWHSGGGRLDYEHFCCFQFKYIEVITVKQIRLYAKYIMPAKQIIM